MGGDLSEAPQSGCAGSAQALSSCWPQGLLQTVWPRVEGTGLPRAVCLDSQDAGPFAVKAFRPEPKTQNSGLPARALPPPPRTHVLAESTACCSVCAVYKLLHHSRGQSHCPAAVLGTPSEPPLLSQQPGPPAGWARPREESAAPPAVTACLFPVAEASCSPDTGTHLFPGNSCWGSLRSTQPRPGPALWPPLHRDSGCAAWLGRNAEATAESTTCSGKSGPWAQVQPCLARPSWSHRTFWSWSTWGLWGPGAGEAEPTPSVLWPAPQRPAASVQRPPRPRRRSILRPAVSCSEAWLVLQRPCCLWTTALLGLNQQ